ncbi:Bifunctional peptidase and (3S)-lysyl hydroxylase Jmjd7 [Exophiala dermatitidis]
MTASAAKSPTVSTLLQLIEDYHAFNPGGVQVLPYPAAVEFSKQVSRGRPCVYQLSNSKEAKTILSCPAFSWTKEDLCEKVKQDVEVAVTPDGRADSLYRLPRPSTTGTCAGNNDQPEQSEQQGGNEQYEDVFVQPATVSMPLSSLLDKLCRPRSLSEPRNHRHRPLSTGEPVYYLQSQNSNLTTTPLSVLHGDVPPCIPFSKPVLGEPEAVNIWMGNASSVTSTHRDPYENLYLVVKGKKHFTLWPPCEELCLHAEKVRTAHHILDTSTSPPSFRIALDTPTPTPQPPDTEDEDANRIPWIPIDPLNLPSPDILARQYPYYKYSHPLTVTVSEGEMLYLPSGWFHHVRQECGTWNDGEVAPCIAVNYWFDMDYEGEKYVMREMLGRLVEIAREEESTGDSSATP